MKEFLDENFLLDTGTAQKLYHGYAKQLPIIDYHCHLSPGEIANDKQFENLTEAWLNGDHYKWRAMRANGIDESFCTGNRCDWEKFEQWAGTLPYTVRNPLYHWTHLELQRYFGIKEILGPASARKIYDTCNEMLQSKEFSVRNLLLKMNIELICTTDDPIDTLEPHQQIKQSGFRIKILPAFRPDQAMKVDDPAAFQQYLNRLETSSRKSISSMDDYLAALKSRHDYFNSMGCRLSDHGLEEIYADEYTDKEIATIFSRLKNGKQLGIMEQRKFKSSLLLHLAQWDWEKGWVQQFHLGAMRNNNTRMMRSLGPDTGWDSIGDFSQGRSLAAFLARLDDDNRLPKTILYNLNPADNELMATMTGNFNDGSVPGKVQWGPAWWFLDQKDGMTAQINILSRMGLLSRFVGMVTDSRSFLSYPRHEYFRRILCNLFGQDIENGELPNDEAWTGQIIQDICYNNALHYFQW